MTLLTNINVILVDGVQNGAKWPEGWVSISLRGSWQMDVPVWGGFLCIYSSSCIWLENWLLWWHFNLWKVDIRARWLVKLFLWYIDIYCPFPIVWVDFIVTPGILGRCCHRRGNCDVLWGGEYSGQFSGRDLSCCTTHIHLLGLFW